MRPSVSGPTGTLIGAPVSTTSLPRTMPSVLSMAMQRTVRLAELLRHFEHQRLVVVLGVQRVLDEGQLALELHVHHGAEHLGDPADIVLCHAECSFAQTASAPEMISISSRVMLAWRVRL